MLNGSARSRCPYERIGDTRRDEGDPQKSPRGLTSKALAIRERLAAKDPGNAELQREVSVLPTKGSAISRRDEGDRKGALEGLTRRPSPSESASPQRIPAMPNGGAMSR